MCGGCPGLTWKRVASLSGEVSPLAWLGGGIGDLGTKGERGVLHLPQQHAAPRHPWHGTARPFPCSPPGRWREAAAPGSQLGPVGQVTAARAAWPRHHLTL